MPIYEYKCEAGHFSTSIRKVNGRNRPKRCDVCACPALLSIPRSNVNAWQEDWEFNHMRPEGDSKMSFANESAYRAHLKTLHADETSLGIREI